MKLKIKSCSINHIETLVPSNIVRNQDLGFDDKLIQKVIKNTGIIQRHTLGSHESLMPLYLEVALKTMQKLDWDKEAIDGIVVVTQTPEYQLPSNSTVLHGQLNLRMDVFAYDISMGCSGYIYGLYNVMSSIAASEGGVKRVLLFAGDAISTVIDEKNDSNAFLFGDAVSCTAIEFNKESQPTTFVLKTEGSTYDNIILKQSGLKGRESLFTHDGNPDKVLHMDGSKIFIFSVENIPKIIEETLEFANLGSEDIDKFCFQQSSKFTIDYISKKIGIKTKAPINIQNFGNTSSASIPLLLTSCKPNRSNSMLVGFGVGMSIGISIVDLSNTTYGHGVSNYSAI